MQSFFFPLHRIVYTTEPVEDKVFLVGEVPGKKVRSFKANMKTNFDNVNFKDENNVEEDGDDDCRRKIISLEEDIVWYYPTLVDIPSYLPSPFMWIWFMLTECRKRSHLPARNNSLFFVCAVFAVAKGKDWLARDRGTICQFFSYGCSLKDGGETCWHWISFPKRKTMSHGNWYDMWSVSPFSRVFTGVGLRLPWQYAFGLRENELNLVYFLKIRDII